MRKRSHNPQPTYWVEVYDKNDNLVCQYDGLKKHELDSIINHAEKNGNNTKWSQE